MVAELLELLDEPVLVAGGVASHHEGVAAEVVVVGVSAPCSSLRRARSASSPWCARTCTPCAGAVRSSFYDGWRVQATVPVVASRSPGSSCARP